MVIAIAVFTGVVVIIVGAYELFVVRPERRLLERLQPEQSSLLQARLLRPERATADGSLPRLLAAIGPVIVPIRRYLVQSHVRITLAPVLIIVGVTGLATFVLVATATRQEWLAVAAGLLAATVPPLYVRWARRRWMARFEEQLPEAVDLIARALRAGHGLIPGLGMVADELPAPIGPEFRMLYDEQKFGLTLQDAMHNFAERVPVLDARFFVTAVLTQRDAGGNLAEVLDNLASVIRDRFRVKRQIRVISTHGRTTGWVLVLLPPSLAAGFLLISHDHIEMLIRDPLGVRMIIAAAALQLIGTFVIRRIINVEY